MRALSALRASPERSFEALYRRHAPHVYRYALALLGSPPDAEDVTQTTFLNAYRAIERGERPRHPGAWLHTIALNLCRQRFRQAARRPTEVPLEEDVADLVVDDQQPTVEDLTRALKHLPFNQRAALVMREFEGLAPPEIARSLAVSTSAVEALLFRARRGLREQLEGRLTCEQAERALSLQLDGLLARPERGALRAHLRECGECARLARSMRGQRGALKSLAVLPLPSALASVPQIGAGASVAGAGAGVSVAGAGAGVPLLGTVAAKLAVGAAATALLGGLGYKTVTHHPRRDISHRLAAPGRPARVRLTPAATDLPPRPTLRRPVERRTLTRPSPDRGARVVSRDLAAPPAVPLPAFAPTAPAANGAQPDSVTAPTRRSPKTSESPPKSPKPVRQHATNVKHGGNPKQAKPKPAPGRPKPVKPKPGKPKPGKPKPGKPKPGKPKPGKPKPGKPKPVKAKPVKAKP